MALIIPKRLGELLQEQQEPFILEAHLLEKGCLINGLNLERSFRSCSWNSNGFWKRPVRLRVNKRRTIFRNCSNVVKAVFGKLVLTGSRQKVKKKKNHGTNDETGDWDVSVSNPCSESETEDGPNPLQKIELPEDKKLRPSYGEDIEELSSATVLEETPSNEDPSAPGDNIVTYCEFIVKPREEPNSADVTSQKLAPKRVLHQSKQLFLDCMRELIESRKWKLRMQRNLFQFLGPKDVGKLLYEDVRIWSGLSGNESNINQLLHVDLGDSFGEWSDFKRQVRGVSAEIGDAILQDIIGKEIVDDMVQSHF